MGDVMHLDAFVVRRLGSGDVKVLKMISIFLLKILLRFYGNFDFESLSFLVSDKYGPNHIYRT